MRPVIVRRCLILILVCCLTGCGVPTNAPTFFAELADPTPDTQAWLVASPVALPTMLAHGDTQISRSLMTDRDDFHVPFATPEELLHIPNRASIVPATAPPAEQAWESKLLGPTLVPYQGVGTYRRDWVESAILTPNTPFAGMLWLGGSFHVNGEDTHDLLVTALLDYHQIDFALGGRLARGHIARIPRDRVLIYELSLPEPIPEGKHTLSIVVNWDPWNIYTTRALRNTFAVQGKMRWGSAGPLMFDHINISNKYLIVGKDAPPPIALQTVADSQPVPPDAGASLILSRGSRFSDPIWRQSQALAADEPGKLYAYVNYKPSATLTETSRMTAVLTLFLDDRQVPIAGKPAFFWEVEEGRQYRIPIELNLPNDERVHVLYAAMSFTPFLQSGYFEHPRPNWLQFDAFAPEVVLVVPNRSWIPWLSGSAASSHT